MRSRLRGVAVAVLAMWASAAFAEFDEDDLNLITFANLTDNDILYIFLSPGDSEYWGPEILGSERILASGDSLGFYILYPNPCDLFDIMAVDDEGGTFVIRDYEICDGEQELIEIVRKDLTEDAPEMDFATVYIGNDTLPVYYIFISPGDSEMWGVDYLDENTILDMDGVVSFLFPVSEESTQYEVLAVDEEADTYEFSFAVDLDSDETVQYIEIDYLQ